MRKTKSFQQTAKKCKQRLWSVYPSAADLYHFDTDPDPGTEKFCYGSGSRQKLYGFGIRFQIKKKFEIKNAHFTCIVCLHYLFITFIYIIIIKLGLKK